MANRLPINLGIDDVPGGTGPNKLVKTDDLAAPGLAPSVPVSGAAMSGYDDTLVPPLLGADDVQEAIDALKGGGGGGAPNNATYLTLSVAAGLLNERVFTPGTGLSAVDAGAGGLYTLSATGAYVPAVPSNYNPAPSTTSTALDQISARKRDFFNASAVPGVKVVLYIRTTGNDDTAVPDNVALPFLTTEGAQRFVAQAPILGGYSAGYYELDYGPGAFPLPAALPGWAGITSVVTDVSVSDTRNVTAIVQNTANGGNAVTLDGAAIANGALRGEIVEFLTAGLVQIAYGVVYENIGNTIYFETNETATLNPVIPVTAVVRFLAQNTIFTQPTSGTVFSGPDIVGALVWTGGDFSACSLEFQGGFGCDFYRVKMGGVTVSDTLQIVWTTCTFANGIGVKSGGNAWVGDGTTFLDAAYGVYIEGGLLLFTGVTVFARIAPRAAIVGVGVVDVSEYTTGVRLLRMVDCPYVLRANDATEYRVALGGSYYLPRCASTTGLTGVTVKAITATGGAQVKLGTLSNIVITGSLNPVSADDGATACSTAVDGTRISGGTPTPGPAGFTYRAVLGDSPLDPLTDQTLGVQTSGGTPIINIPLPDVTQITPGARWTVNFEVGAGVGGRDVTLTPSLGQTVGMALGAFSLTAAGVGSIDLIANPSGNWLKA